MDEFHLTMSHDEALVIFEWLASLEERGISAYCDQAEQAVLWKIEGALESQLPDVLLDDYKDRVDAAKRRIMRIDSP